MAVEAGYSSCFTDKNMLMNMNSYPPPSDFTLPTAAATMASSTDLGKKTIRSGSKRTRDFMTDDFMASSFHFQQQQMNIDRIISIHAEKIRVEVLEKHKAQSLKILAAVGEAFGRKMKEKEEEIEKMGRVNWVLQEKVKSLWIENQLWRDMAETSEATAVSLRCSLERALMAAAGGGAGGGRAEEEEDDCVSSSGSVDPSRKTKAGGEDDEEEEEEGEMVKQRRRIRMCRKCGEEESMVLVLPCRHLCVCNVCGSSSLASCPVCNSAVNASVRINLT